MHPREARGGFERARLRTLDERERALGPGGEVRVDRPEQQPQGAPRIAQGSSSPPDAPEDQSDCAGHQQGRPQPRRRRPEPRPVRREEEGGHEEREGSVPRRGRDPAAPGGD